MLHTVIAHAMQIYVKVEVTLKYNLSQR